MAAPEFPEASSAGRKLHRKALVIDALLWGAVERPSGMVDGKDLIDRFVEAGLTAGVQTLAALPHDDFMHAVINVHHYMSLVEAKPDKCLIVKTSGDILRAKRENEIGLVLGFQSTTPIKEDLRLLTIFHTLGIRIVGLSYNYRHVWGDGCYEPHDQGLTGIGRAGVRDMNRLGVVIDLSHVGIRTSLDAIEISNDPVVFSHSNVRKLTDHVRNLTDDQIRAIGSNDGVIGVSTHSVFSRLTRTGRPTLDDLLRHLEYIVDMIGIDHVGLGTDMVSTEGIHEKIFGVEVNRVINGFHSGLGPEARFVDGFASFAEVGNLTDLLVQRGYREEDVLRVMGGNFMRVFNAVWDKGDALSQRDEMM